MTQTADDLFATPGEVAALIGGDVTSLPAGPALIEDATITADEFPSALADDPRSFTVQGKAYVWRDGEGAKIAEVLIPAQQSKLLYQKIEYNAAGQRITRYEQLASGRTNSMRYHANGVVAHSRHGYEYGRSPAVLHQFFDEHGRLHNVAGYARYTKTDAFIHQEAYHIHGAQCVQDEFKAHPARQEYLRQQRAIAVAARWYNRLIRAVAGLFKKDREEEAPPPRQATLKADVLIDIAANLSEADKLRLLKAISSSFNEETRPDVADATVQIVAPQVKFARRPKPVK